MKTSFKKIEIGNSFFDKNGDLWKKKSDSLASRAEYTLPLPFSENTKVIPVSTPKVLIYVKGGVAEFATEGDVEVQLADQDDADHDDQGHDLLPKSFANLAKQFKLPIESK